MTESQALNTLRLKLILLYPNAIWIKIPDSYHHNDSTVRFTPKKYIDVLFFYQKDEVSTAVFIEGKKTANKGKIKDIRKLWRPIQQETLCKANTLEFRAYTMLLTQTNNHIYLLPYDFIETNNGLIEFDKINQYCVKGKRWNMDKLKEMV